MKITVESTSKIVELNGVPARIWEGHTTDSGIKIHCFITRVACDEDALSAEFEKELLEQRKPSAALEVYPLRLIL